MTIRNKILYSLVSIGFFVMVSVAYPAPMVRFPSGVNPHDQITDEGEVLFQKCLFCHKTVPDVKKVKSIKDVDFRYDRFSNFKDLCYRCHPERMHPGGSWLAYKKKWRKFGAPNHWVKPPEKIAKKREDMLKKMPTILPLDPKTGKITCPTCHNPHERGLLQGKAGVGADGERRLRQAGVPICLMCHEK